MNYPFLLDPTGGSDRIIFTLSDFKPENILLEQKARCHFTERGHKIQPNIVWLKKNYIRILRENSSVKMLVSRNKESNEIFLQINLENVTYNVIPDIYGNVTAHLTLENDPIYHHCHIQLKKKNWLNQWEPLLQNTSPLPITQSKISTSIQENNTPRKITKESSYDSIRPRSFSNDSRRRREKGTPTKPHQRRRSAHPSHMVLEDPLDMEYLPNPVPSVTTPKTLQRESAPTTPSIKQLEDIFERGSENRAITQDINLADIHELLRKIYKETVQLKKEVRLIKADLAELKEHQNLF